MADDRAGTRGPSGSSTVGRRVARHAAEQSPSQPYVGRRVARPVLVPPPAPEPVVPAAPVSPAAPYAGRRVARVVPEPVAPVEAAAPVVPVTVVAPAVATEPLVAPVVEPEPLPMVVEPQVIRPAPAPVVAGAPVFVEPVVIEPVVLQPALPEPAVPATTLSLDAFVAPPVPDAEPVTQVVAPVDTVRPAGRRVVAKAGKPTSVSGRRVASRRDRRGRLPSLPLLGGIAVLAISAGGALQAMSPGLSNADSQHLTPASAMSGSSAVASANLLGGRGTTVSRDSNRLQAAADAKAKQRDEALSAFAAQAQKQASKIQLHQWVLPVQAGVYHLTARFGEYSALWSHFHTGLDFAAPTGTPIMAVAGGTITETGYSGAYGNRTIETLPDGTELWYCHQNEFGTTVGASVRPGQTIGYVGSTGNVTGPHLHLEVHPGGGDAVDPYAALVAHGLYPGPPN
jgi:murein DD-endopeptidase MepM/ murein hydrolase activator NlpD